MKQFASSTPLNSAESPAVKLTRTPLSPIPGRNTPVTSTPALKRRVAFDVVDSSDCFTPEMPVYRGTPFLSRFGFKTPSGVIHAGDSPSAKHKRTKSTSHQKEFVSPRKHVRRCSAHASSNGRLPSTTDTPFTPSGLMCSVTQADDSCEAESLVFTPSVKTRRATPPHLSQKLSAVDHSVSFIVDVTKVKLITIANRSKDKSLKEPMKTQRKTSKRLKRGKTWVKESRLVEWRHCGRVVKVGPGFKNLYRHSLGLFSFNLNSNPWLVTVNSQLV